MKPQRLYIEVPRDTWEQVKGLAYVDRRSPRQQIEYLVICAVKGKCSEDASREPASAGVASDE
jgi:hypothetical protein